MKTVLLLGGGSLLLEIAEFLRTQPVRTLVLSSKRHLDAPLQTGPTLRERLAGMEAETVEIPKLDKAALLSLKVDLSETLALSTAAPWIIKQDVIDALGGRIYNLHGARLPRDRGGATASWNIMRGEDQGVALMHRVDAGIDTGNIIDSHEFLYEDCRTPRDYQRRYDHETMLLVRRAMPPLLRGEHPEGTPQPSDTSSYWPRLNTDVHGWINWTWTGLDIARFIAAFDDPHPGAKTFLRHRVVRLKDCTFESSHGQFHPFQAGLIYRISGAGIVVCATTGSLIARRVLDEGGGEVDASTIEVGDRLFTPVEKLEAALRARARYTPAGPVTNDA